MVFDLLCGAEVGTPNVLMTREMSLLRGRCHGGGAALFRLERCGVLLGETSCDAGRLTRMEFDEQIGGYVRMASGASHAQQITPILRRNATTTLHLGSGGRTDA